MREEQRVSFTRAEFIHTLLTWERDVKGGEVERFVDAVFNGTDGVIEFNPRAKAGQRLT